MVGCFVGSMMLIWPDGKKKKAEEEKHMANSGTIPPLYIGVITCFIMVIFYSIV